MMPRPFNVPTKPKTISINIPLKETQYKNLKKNRNITVTQIFIYTLNALLNHFHEVELLVIY